VADYPVRLEATQVAEMIARGVERIEFLDVREAWEVDLCVIARSRHIPMNEVPARSDELPRDRALVVVCHHGVRSLKVAQWLRAQGFENAINLDGGIDEWARVIEPQMATY
jgi:rhodanese-related sulfurtransferase